MMRGGFYRLSFKPVLLPLLDDLALLGCEFVSGLRGRWRERMAQQNLDRRLLILWTTSREKAMQTFLSFTLPLPASVCFCPLPLPLFSRFG
jgi:hypothetical protein